MMPSARSLAPVGSGLTALALVLAFARVAHADECVADTDCGHGFSCETMVVSGTGGAAGAAGTASGGSAGTTGSGGTTAGASGSSSGGTGSGAFAPATGGTGTGAAAGTGSAGTGSGGTGEVPVMPDYCGDALCQTLSETVETCPEDCSNYKYCAPSACMSVAECAEGYVCVGQTRPGTGGVGGASGTGGTAGTAGTGSGAAAIICGDGLCIAPENATTCPADCGFMGQCQPQVGVCSSDANCPADYYCELMTTMGTGGGSAMGGAGGAAGAGGSTGGFATGGTAMADPGTAGAPGGTTGSGDLVALQGVCMPRNGGAGGTGGTGMGGTGMGGDGVGGACPGGGCGAGGVTTGGTSSGVGGSMAGTSGTGAGTAGTGDAGTGPGSGGTGGTGSGGSGTSSGGSGTGASMNGGSGGSSHDVVTHAGCSVSHPRDASSTGAFALFGLALAWSLRRRRAH